MQKYVLVKFLEDIGEGAEFAASNWPLHVTLVSNFAVDWEATNLYTRLSALLVKQQPVTTTAQADTYFGAQQQVQVTLLDMTEELQALHNNVITLLKSAHADFDEPNFLEAGFRAHATVQPHARLHKGELITIDELSLVDMYPDSDINRRKLLKTIKMSA